jgi:cysteine-rich repeat protein
MLPACGDGVMDSGEVCDDGNAVDGDGCAADCSSGPCGNGVVEGDEECDDGADNSDSDPDACRLDCTWHDVCGDATDDGVLTVSDALEVLKGAIGEGACPFSLCDTDGDGSISPTDGLRIVRAAVGLDVSMDCGLVVTLVLDDNVEIGAMMIAVDYSATGSTFIGERGGVRCTSLLPGSAEVTFDNNTSVATLVADVVAYEEAAGPIMLAECRFLADAEIPPAEAFIVEVLDYPGMSQAQPAPLVWLDY